MCDSGLLCISSIMIQTQQTITLILYSTHQYGNGGSGSNLCWESLIHPLSKLLKDYFDLPVTKL